ncbi:MAG: CaiB/BaiF CoA transferase family protein [Acetobacteraceae bacterium]
MPTPPPPTPRPAHAPLALAGVRVADFSHFIAGPLCGMILGDMGAEVIKIEKVDGGDDFRRLGPAVTDQEGAPFLWTNRNKRGIALDLKQPEGQAIARTIVAQSDVLLENFSSGVMERFNLGYDALAAENPRLIYCAVSAYGRSGPLRNRLGFDPITQAESGFMAMNGEPDQIGLRAGPSIMDMSTAMMACNATLGALFSRERTGRGQFIETALFDQAVTMVGFHALNYLVSGREPQRFGNNSRDTVPTAAFETADRPLYIACANDRTWQRLAAQVLDRPELATQADYATTPDRIRNRDALLEIVQEILRSRPRAHWLARMNQAGVPGGAINSIAEAFDGEEIAARGLVSTIPHPTAGSVPNVALSIRLHGTPLADPVAAPTLGQHTDAVLRDLLGYDAARIAALREKGVVR